MAREHLVAQALPRGGSGPLLGEDMSPAIDDVHAAALAEPLHRRAALKLEEIDSGLAAREDEHHAYTPRSDLLELRTEIARQVNPEEPGHIAQLRFQGQERAVNVDSQNSPDIHLPGH